MPAGGQIIANKWTSTVAALLCWVVLLPAHLAAQSQADRVWLRIETGTHNGKVSDAATDASGRLLVTASDDKTARVWSLPDLRPLGVLRPPIGEGDEGQLYAVAVSPDGRTAAVGGYTGGERGDSNIYIFDLATRAIAHRIAGVPASVSSLAYGPNGRLVAGLAGSNGIRVWHNDTLVLDDHDYGDQVHGLDFAPDGRLAAGSNDGSLRLYSPNGTLLRTQLTDAGKWPYSLRFSPDGARLAVGFKDVAAIEVRDGTMLAMRARPNVNGLIGRDLSHVAWSLDGQEVLAGGDVLGSGSRAIFVWDRAGAGTRNIAAIGFDDAISAIVSPADGGLVFTSLAGDIAVATQQGVRQHEVRPRRGDLGRTAKTSDPTWRFRAASNGKQVEWVTFSSQARLLRFEISSGYLTVGQPEAAGLVNWTADADGLHASDWLSQLNPKLNGYALEMHQNEIARSVAVGHHRLLLGTEWYLRMFDANGSAIWPNPAPVPGTAWRVNQSQDGRLAIAALGDGTIRWYRADDGQELLALMVTEDAKCWVAFTPSGYYTAGPGSEDLIGWHVNRGLDQAADFFPASRFRDRFYRPDVVQRVLDTLDEAAAVQQADAALGSAAPHSTQARTDPQIDVMRDRPPVVTIVSPREGAQLTTGQAELQVNVRSPTGRPITRVEARVNGRPATEAIVGAADQQPAPAPERAERRHITVPLSIKEDATIQVIAWSDDRSSEAAIIHLTASSLTPPSPVVADLSKPRLNAVLVGISAYKDPELHLKFAAKDAADLEALLQRQQGGLYREVNTHLVPEAKATRDGILEQVLWLRRQTTQRDLAILFLAGHGIAEDVEYYFLTVDADPDSPAIRALSGTELRTQLRQIPGHTIALLDTCYAGALIRGQQSRDLPLDIGKLVAELSAAETGVAVYSATTNRQRAAELDSLHNGVFTAALLDVLSGRYGEKSLNLSPIRVNYLAALLAERVMTLSNGRQASAYNALDPIRDVPLFVVR